MSHKAFPALIISISDSVNGDLTIAVKFLRCVSTVCLLLLEFVVKFKSDDAGRGSPGVSNYFNMFVLVLSRIMHHL